MLSYTRVEIKHDKNSTKDKKMEICSYNVILYMKVDCDKLKIYYKAKDTYIQYLIIIYNEKGYIYMEKETAPHSSTLAWKIPWTEEPGRLQSMGSQRVGYD